MLRSRKPLAPAASAPRGQIVLAVVLIAASLLGVGPTPSHAAPAPMEFYRVQEGDTWGRIAAKFRVPVLLLWRANGVTNPARLKKGQRLFIPSADAEPRGDILVFEVKDDSSTLWAALGSGASLISLLYLNSIASPAEAFGQVLYAPDVSDAVRAIVAAQPPEPASNEDNGGDDRDDDDGDDESGPPPEGALIRSRMGIQGHFLIADDELRQQMLDMAAYDIGFGWIKQQVRWDEFEWLRGNYSEEMLQALDKFVHDAYQRDMRILLSIAHAPDWARSTTEEDGPPVDYNDYYNFIGFIVARYKYMLSAIEVWNEPNLGREWRGAPLNGGEYVRLLAGAYDRVKREYPEGNLTVVSAGLAPTGVSDGVNAVDDRTFLRQMYEAGVENYADAIGIHPYGWGNPPWTRCCGDWGGAPSHNDHPTFFFLNTIEDYRAIQAQFGGVHPFWATEFGWGTMDGLDRPVPAEAPFFSYINQGQQGEYIVEAYRMAQEWDFMGPMFLWNFNIAALPDLDSSQSGYSLLQANESGEPYPRQAYEILRDAPKTDT